MRVVEISPARAVPFQVGGDAPPLHLKTFCPDCGSMTTMVRPFVNRQVDDPAYQTVHVEDCCWQSFRDRNRVFVDDVDTTEVRERIIRALRWDMGVAA